MPVPVFETGFDGDATIGNGSAGTFTFPVVEWSRRAPATIQRYVNSKTGLHPARASTVRDAEVTIILDYSQEDQPFQDDVDIQSGDLVTNVNLKISSDADDGFTYTSMIVTDTPVNLKRDGKTMVELHLAINSGTEQTPGNTTPI